MKIDGYRQFGGKYAETAALKNVLAHLGVTAPHTGQPFSEEILFGIVGGIGLGYFVYQMPDYASLFIATRIMTEESARPGFLLTLCERLGLNAEVQNASSVSAAEKKLKQALDRGRPLIAWVDPRNLPFYGTPNGYHALVIYGFDDDKDEAYVADRSDKALTLTRAELNAARQGEGAPRFRALRVDVPKPMKTSDLQKAVKQGIRDCCDQMQNGFGPPNFKSNFGLKALEKWADLLTNPKDKRGWPKYFPAGRHLFGALTSAFDQIEHRGGGSAFRPMYADFLVEAGTVLKQPKFKSVAEQFRDSAQLWSALAAALLPDSVPLFKEKKQLAARKRTLFGKKDTASIDAMQSVNSRLDEIHAQVGKSFPLSDGEVARLLADVRDRVLAIYASEERAIAALQKAI